MTMMMITDVWDSYPGDGDELVLALALADRAADDGTVQLDHSYLRWRCRMTSERYVCVLALMQANDSLELIDEKKGIYQFTFRR